MASMKTTVTEHQADLVVDRKDVVAAGVVVLTLRPAHGGPLPAWRPGAHLDLLLPGGLTRQYSLCGDPADRTAYRVGVLLEPESRGGSRYVHETLATGSTVATRGPRNNFALLPSPRYTFVAGGIGVTPILPMVAAAAAAGADWRLLYGGRTRGSMAFLDELSAYGDSVTVAPQDETGLLDLASWLAAPRPDTKVYCCGPEPLLQAVERQCASWPGGALHVERFTAKEAREPVRLEAFEVVLHRSGLTLTVPPGVSILHAVEQAGVPVLSSCQEGTCGTCETTVLDGEPDHRDSLLTEEEQAAGDLMMICVSRSCSPRLVLEL